ncbi:hypothetical protein K4F52_008083 [Lecanicillium sp. MT-2017a]|nr:hypothetical protein K4F52_008083 [Lecanicillium sp. MT-2017a]
MQLYAVVAALAGFAGVAIATDDSCVAEYGQCYFPGEGSKACCEGLICVADRCRDVSNL